MNKVFDHLSVTIEEDGTVMLEDPANAWKYSVPTFAKPLEMADELQQISQWLRSITTCASPNCPNPHFTRKRKTQKYCEACVAETQKKQKREWWNRNRGKRIKQEQAT